MNIIHCAANHSHRTSTVSMKKLIYPAADRNKGPILEVLKNYIEHGPNQKFLEISSGSGQHIAHFAPHFPQVNFYPSEFNIELFDSISAYCSEFSNIEQPMKIDISEDFNCWPNQIFHENFFDYIYNANLMHISPFNCSEGLFRNCGKLLKKNGLLFTYGPFSVNGNLYPESNVQFDQNLRFQNPTWGIRDIKDLEKLGHENGICLINIHDMPANNKILIWKKM